MHEPSLTGPRWERQATPAHYFVRPDRSRGTRQRPPRYGLRSDPDEADGRRIVYTASWTIIDPDDSENLLGRSAIYTATWRGRQLRLLRRGGESPAWSPRGNVIAFLNRQGDIATIRPDGSGYRRVLRAAPGVFRTNLDYAPDGRRLLYQAYFWRPRAYVNRIGILDLATGRNTYLPARVSKRVSAATWSPDGKRIAYSVARDIPPVTVWSVRPDGTGKRRLFTAPAGSPTTPRYIDHLAWQPRP